jgi:hypothetical protein
MIRFTWLQFRTQAAVAIGGLAVVAVVLAVAGPHLAHLYDTMSPPAGRMATVQRPPQRSSRTTAPCK